MPQITNAQEARAYVQHKLDTVLHRPGNEYVVLGKGYIETDKSWAFLYIEQSLLLKLSKENAYRVSSLMLVDRSGYWAPQPGVVPPQIMADIWNSDHD